MCLLFFVPLSSLLIFHFLLLHRFQEQLPPALISQTLPKKMTKMTAMIRNSTLRQLATKNFFYEGQQVKPTTGDSPTGQVCILQLHCAPSLLSFMLSHPLPAQTLPALTHTPIHWVHAHWGENPLCNRGRGPSPWDVSHWGHLTLVHQAPVDAEL